MISETGTFNQESDWVHDPKNKTEEGWERDVGLAALFEPADEVDVRVAVRTSDGWRVEQRRDRWFRATAHALGAAPDEVIIDPPSAHAAVVEGLQAVVASHEGDV